MSSLGNKEIFAKNLRKYMRQFNKDRSAMVEELGFKYTTFNDWFHGKTYPRIDNIEKIANYFGVSKADLIEEAPSDPPIKFPAKFTDPQEARSYLNMHTIFGSQGLDVSEMDDERVIEFANDLLQQLAMAASFKYDKYKKQDE